MFPKPTVAAITGHAVAGGCVLAICCDYRFIADGHKLMGLNEIKLGVPVPYVPSCILPQLVGNRFSRTIMESGDLYPPEELSRMGVVDRILPVEEVIPEAVTHARLLGAAAPKVFATIKLNRTEEVRDRILERLGEREKVFLECWQMDEARHRLRAAAEKF